MEQQSFNLTEKELQSFGALEQDNLRANATYGVLARQMEDAKQRIAQSEEAQRQFIRTTLHDRGVDQFREARIEPGRIICTMLDDAPMMGKNPLSPRANGELRNAID